MDHSIRRKGPAIYMASRASVPARPQHWEALREGGLNVISTWHRPENLQPGIDMRTLWDHIEQEVSACDVLILYVDPNDLPLKGAYVEAGMALAWKKRVIVVYKGRLGQSQDGDILRQHLGSWLTHRNVMVCESIQTALFLIDRGIDHATYQAARR